MTRLMQEHLLRGKLDLAPLAKPKTRVEALPDVAPPDLTDLIVEVPVPPPVTPQLLEAAAAELVRAHGEVVMREGEAPIESDDEVLVDLIGYANGRVVPGSAKTQVWLTPEDDVALPGLRGVLNGQTIGKSIWTKVKYPEDASVPEFAGQQLVYAIDILAARAVQPAALDAPSLLEAAGVTEVDELLGLINDGLESEREQTAIHYAQLAIAHEVQARLGDTSISDDIIDAELAHRWNETEGVLLRDKGLSVDDQSLARDAFVQAPMHRAELVHGLRTTMALASLAKAHDVRPTKEDLDAWVEQMAAVEGRSADEVLSDLKADTDAHAAVGQALLLEKTFAFVLGQAQIRWLEEPIVADEASSV